MARERKKKKNQLKKSDFDVLNKYYWVLYY